MSEGTLERGRTVGRYTVFGEIASGGMASVHLGRLQGTGGFARTVAIKRLHPALAKDAQLVTMLLDEARTSARIQHPNVVSTLDVIEDQDEVLLVLEYVHGESLANLLATVARKGQRAPVEVVAAIVAGALHGLHAAHEAKDEMGVPLELVHRDVSPQNILVDDNGNARLLDFGVAKALGRQQISQIGVPKGKLAYMAPEQVHGNVSRRSDVFSMGVVLWEALTGEHLFQGKSDGEILAAVLMAKAPSARSKAPNVPEALDAVLLRSLRRLPEGRFATALDFAQAIEASVHIASAGEVADWLQKEAAEVLAKRDQLLLLAEESVVPAPAPAPRSRAAVLLRPRTLVAIGAALVLLSVGVASTRTTTPAPGPAPPSPSLAASVPAIDSAPSSAALTPDEAEPASSDSPPSPASSEPRPRAARGSRGRCDPPWTLDAKGHKIYKRYCF